MKSYTYAGSTFSLYSEMYNGECWALVGAYQHDAGVQISRTYAIPTSPTTSQSHVRLGTTYGVAAANVDKLRVYCHTSGHGRIIHFTHTASAQIEQILFDSGSASASSWSGTGYTPMSDHTGYLPGEASSTVSYNAWDFPFFSSHKRHFAVRPQSHRYECDDNCVNGCTTLHQMWMTLT